MGRVNFATRRDETTTSHTFLLGVRGGEAGRVKEEADIVGWERWRQKGRKSELDVAVRKKGEKSGKAEIYKSFEFGRVFPFQHKLRVASRDAFVVACLSAT